MKKLHFLVALLIISITGNAQWYTIQSCTYSVIPGAGTALPSCDDCMSGMVPIGFTFPFYGQNYTQCDISSNGWLTFNAGMPSVYPGQTMPYATIPTMIAWSWDDMYTVGATFNYFTTGSAPNRIFVVNYNNVGYCCSSANQATVQIQLYETTGEIRMVSTNNNHGGRTATMGLQNTAVGSITYPGRNASSWSSAANECVSWMYTPPASALNFDNNNDYITCATTSALNITGAITLEAWVNRSANGSDDCIIGKDNWASNNGYSLWVFSNNRACMRFGNIANFSVSTITPGVWTHIAATYSAGTMRMYINGVLDATFTGVPNPASNTGNLYLGTPQDAVGNPLYTFNGSMDEVRIWNRALSQYEIQQTMNCEIPTTSSGLLANYHFNEGIASMNNAGVVTLPDATGNGFTGTLSNFALNGSTSNWIAPGGVTNGTACCALVSSSVTAQTNVSCNGGSNGTATVTASGGTTFTYSWAPSGGTGATGTGLAAGTYTCTVTNECGNTNTSTVTITQPSAITVTAASQTNVSCNGGTNGAASINTPTGGAGGYTYNWTPGNPTGDGTVSVTGLTAGTWTCTVTDANSCTATQTFNITAPTALVLNALSQTNVSCFGGSNGAAAVSPASGGAGGYTYNWTPGNPTGDGTTSVTGLVAGTWTCTVTDANSCTTTRTFNITSPTALVVTAASQTNVSCNGGTNGAASINTPTGGAGGYTYNWTPGNPTGDGTVSVTGLTAGTWTCTVTDANSCTATQTFNITAPTALVLNALSQTNVSCFGGSNGAAAVSPASGGAGGYTYNWTPGNPTGDGTTSVTGLVAGTWTCTVTDANSCTTTRTFNITSPTALVVTAASQTNISCNGGSNGAASINTPTGGAGGYTYNWTPGNPTGDGTVSVTGLTAGSWTCTVTDANSCTATQTFNVTAPSAITANISSTSTSCVGNTGTASVSAVTGGAGSYTYSWAPSGGTAATATGLAAGTYTCTITDANLCTITRTVTVTTTSGPSLTALSQTNVSCFGGTNGAACVNNATGGTAPYTYNWTPGNPTGDGTTCVTGLTAGTWSCTVTDANNCTALVTFNITSPSAISLSATATPTVICAGQSSTISAGASGGSGSFTYLWMPGNMTSASTSVSPTVTTTYTVTATDANACTAVTVLTVSVNPLPAVALTGTNHFCPGGSTLLTGTSGGTSQWYLNGVAIIGATSNTYLATMPGVYNMIKTNTNGCFDSSAVGITVTVDTPPSISSVTSTPVACFGDSNGSATVTATGTPALTYAWAPSGGTGTTESGLSAGTYTVTVTDGNTCTSTATVSVTSPAMLMTLPSQTNVTCFGGNDATATVTASGGTAGYTYMWTPVLPPTASNSNLTAGAYSCVVTDANGCTSTATFNITEPAPIAVSQTVTICNGDSLVVGSSVYTTAGMYMDTLTSVLGCDSTVTTSLMVNPVPAVISVTNAAVCDSGAVILNASASGGANLTWYSDSLLTVNVNTGNSYSTPMLYTTTTYYVQADSAGCYSAASPVTVTVNTGAVTINQSLSLCFGDSVTIGSSTYYTSGVYADTISSGGCDSIINSTITVMSQITAMQTLTICSGQSVVVGMNSYNATGIYMDTLTAMNGCDSLVTTDLTVTLPDSSAQSVTVCNGQSYSIGSNTYTMSGVYADTLTNMSGCDSVVTTTLTVLPANVFTQNITLCAGDSISVGNNVYSTAGTYNDTITDMNGCDSLITTVVSINNVDVSVSITGFGGTLNSNASGPNTSWLWYNCQDNTTIISATMQSYTPNANGSFAVIVTQNGCQDTSSCFNITNVGVDEFNSGSLKLYPNPANNFVTLEAQPGSQIVIFDALGNQVDAVNATSDRTDLSLQNYASGIYLVKVISGDIVTTQRLIINR